MAGAGEVFRRPAEFHQHRCLVDHLARPGTDNMHAEHLVGGLVGEHLHKALCRTVGAGAAIGGERELADIILNTSGLQVFLALADSGNLGESIDDTGMTS